jgi:hypothetical protein
MRNYRNSDKLTVKRLQELKDLGFRFVLIKGYALDRRADYIELNHFSLLPVKELPEDPAQKEIYEPIESEILLEWASSVDSGVTAYIDTDWKLT